MKKYIMAVLITAVICISTTVLAVTIIDSKDVSYTDLNENETNVKDALDIIYSNINGSATAADILNGKTAYAKGKFITGTYKTPAINLSFQVGSHGSSEIQHQTRINMSSFSSLYKYFKITTVNCDTNGLCSNIYFNSQCDQGSGNMSVNTQYETANYPGFTVFSTGAKSYYYTVVITLYN